MGLLPTTFRMDILPSPWVDVVADAHFLPFKEQSVDGIAMLDVLHHLSHPISFFEGAVRILKPGGRLAMIEPGITPLSWVFYKFLHDEPVDMQADPLSRPTIRAPRDPFDSNQALPTLLFARERNRAALLAKIPELRMVRQQWLSLIAYPLTGGFRGWSLVPAGWVSWILRAENRLLTAVGTWAAFRLLLVLEKSGSSDPAK
jgi:SAM-dependent methyltransferase